MKGSPVRVRASALSICRDFFSERAARSARFASEGSESPNRGNGVVAATFAVLPLLLKVPVWGGEQCTSPDRGSRSGWCARADAARTSASLVVQRLLRLEGGSQPVAGSEGCADSSSHGAT